MPPAGKNPGASHSPVSRSLRPLRPLRPNPSPDRVPTARKVKRFYGKSLTPPRRRATNGALAEGKFFSHKEHREHKERKAVGGELPWPERLKPEKSRFPLFSLCSLEPIHPWLVVRGAWTGSRRVTARQRRRGMRDCAETRGREKENNHKTTQPSNHKTPKARVERGERISSTPPAAGGRAREMREILPREPPACHPGENARCPGRATAIPLRDSLRGTTSNQ